MPVKTPKKFRPLIDAQNEYYDAKAALAAFAPCKAEIRKAENRLYEAVQSLQRAESVNYLRSLVWRAEGAKIATTKRGDKVWLKNTDAASLVYHTNEMGRLDITTGRYTKTHGQVLAPVVAVMYGPNRCGFWYEAEGKTHWCQMGGKSSLRERFSIVTPDGAAEIDRPAKETID